MSKGSFKSSTKRLIGIACAVTITSSLLMGASSADLINQTNRGYAEKGFDVDSVRVVLNNMNNASSTRVETSSGSGTYVKSDLELASQVAELSFETSRMVTLEAAKLREETRIAEEQAEAIRREEERKLAEEADRLAREEAERQAQEAAEEAEMERQLAIEYAEQTGENVPNYLDFCNSNFKAYMGYTAVTCVSSPQYQLLNGENAYTDANTGIRMVDGRYCIALGSFYTSTIGQKVDLYLETGVVIPCILGDCKADCHTNWDTHQYCNTNGSVAEFIVDYSTFSYLNDGSGTVNWCIGDCGSFNGRITKIVLVE